MQPIDHEPAHPDGGNQVGEPTVKRAATYTAALRRTKRFLQRDWDEDDRGTRRRIQTPDSWLCSTLDLSYIDQEQVVETPSGQQRRRRRLLAAPEFLLGAATDRYGRPSRLRQALLCSFDLWQFEKLPDPAIEVAIPKRPGAFRRIYQAPFLERLMQNCVAHAIRGPLDHSLSDNVHGFRPGRSHLTALHHARSLARLGYHYVAALDVKDCFGSIRLDALAMALHLSPWLTPRLRDIIPWFFLGEVLRKPHHPDRVAKRVGVASPAPGCLLQGMPLAPPLANLVLSEALDKPFAESFGGDTQLLRYADDLLVMASSFASAKLAIQAIARLLSGCGLSLKGGPTECEPVDIRSTPVAWLGRRLHGGQVRAPDAALERQVNRVVRAAGTLQINREIEQLRALLAFDGLPRVDYALRCIRRHSPEAGRLAKYILFGLPRSVADEDDRSGDSFLWDGFDGLEDQGGDDE